MGNVKTIDIGVFIIIYFGFRFAVYRNTGAAIMAVLVLIFIIINKRLRSRLRQRNFEIIRFEAKCNDCHYNISTKIQIKGNK